MAELGIKAAPTDLVDLEAGIGARPMATACGRHQSEKSRSTLRVTGTPFKDQLRAGGS